MANANQRPALKNPEVLLAFARYASASGHNFQLKWLSAATGQAVSTTCTSYKHARAKVEEENAVYGELGSGINSSNTPQKSSNKSRKRKAVDTADGSDDNEVVNGPTGKTRTFTAANQNKAKKRPRGTGTEERSHGRADSEATEPGHGIVKKEDESDVE